MSAVLAADVAPQTEDKRRITEADPDFVLLRSRTQRKLMGSVRQLVREAQASRSAAPTKRSQMLNDAVNSFVQRHLQLLQDAYEQGHVAGQVDYWHSVSNVPGKQRTVSANTATLQRRLSFYAPSVAKMASEVSRLATAPRTPRIAAREASEANISFLLDEPTSLSGWQDAAAPRVALQAQITWPALNDGYIGAGASDTASPFAQVWWNLEPFAKHCEDCPMYAAASPYTAPGAGGNELTNTPGDGSMECGAACKCSLSYDAPAAGPQLDALNQAKADQWSRFLAGDPTSPLQPQTVGGIQPQGTVYTPLQRGYIDEMRSAQEDWNAARGDLPENPDWFKPTDWANVRPTPWGAMTPYQQSILERMSQINMDWLHEVGQLNWPDPPFRPDVATDMRNWLEAASRGDFTPWWNDYAEPMSQHEDLQQWFEWLAQANLWPDPPLIDEKESMEAWLEQVGKSVNWPPDFGRSGETKQAREIGLRTIKLYNPNHDSHGRFTYGNGTAATRVTKGQGRTKRGEGGKRVKNENYNGGKLGAFAAPGSTGAASSDRVQRILAPSLLQSDFAENRRAVAADLANRLKDNEDFQALAKERGVRPEYLTDRMVDNFFSNRGAGDVGAAQLAAKDQFGLTDTSRNFMEVPEKSEALYAAHPEAYRGFVQAQYDSTQEMFAREGITSVTAYRGIGQNDTNLPSSAKLDGGNHEIDISMRPLSSWSVRDTLSAGYARNYRGKGMLMSADIPVSRILSTPITGWGVEDQGEIVVLGGTQHVSYRGFSGWDDRYEGFQR